MHFKKVLDILKGMMAYSLNSCISIITPPCKIMNIPIAKDKLSLELVKKWQDFKKKTIVDIKALHKAGSFSDFCTEVETMHDISKKS